MKFQILLVSLLASYAIGVAVPEAEPEADAEMLEQRAIGDYCQQSGQPDKGTCQKESWCRASAQIGIVSTGDCPNDPNDVKCCYIPDCKSHSGTCHTVSWCNSQGRSHVAGYCPGPSNYQCCLY
ncbi:hypothetical protein BKA64DRAFT_739297 [Cadophora sp. MPI-SDFR-AT-0126]|nr:hypothetical protein BKA64DRAFT_739297 [Leotiomycetes sp. MPI-SDFR-AT-0126]